MKGQVLILLVSCCVSNLIYAAKKAFYVTSTEMMNNQHASRLSEAYCSPLS